MKVTVDAGEEFQVTITRHALEELNLLVGDRIYLSFKSASVIQC